RLRREVVDRPLPGRLLDRDAVAVGAQFEEPRPANPSAGNSTRSARRPVARAYRSTASVAPVQPRGRVRWEAAAEVAPTPAEGPTGPRPSGRTAVRGSREVDPAAAGPRCGGGGYGRTIEPIQSLLRH